MTGLIKKLSEKVAVKGIAEMIWYSALPILTFVITYLKDKIPALQTLESLHVGLIFAFLAIIAVSVVRTFSYIRDIIKLKIIHSKEFAAIKQGSGIFYYSKNDTDKEITKNKEFLIEKFGEATNIDIIGATGFNTFTRNDSAMKATLREAFEKVQGEARILLVNPDINDNNSEILKSRPFSLRMSWSDYRSEILKSIQFLRSLKQQGKNIELKFYCQKPVWKIIRADDFMWLQHYKNAEHVERMPVYGVAREKMDDVETLFEPLHSVFEKKWHNDNNPVYNFATDKIEYSRTKNVKIDFE